MSGNQKSFTEKEVKLEWIPIRNLAVVWPEAQRPYKEKWAKEIADDFDPEKFDPARVMLPNGNGIYHVCEGQHRIAAARMALGHDQRVPCLVAQTADPVQAAEIFLATNTNRDNVSKVSKFKVSVTAKKSDEMSIDKIVRHCGYHVGLSKSQDTIGAVEALKFVYNKGKITLDRTLRVLRDSWAGDPTAVSGPMLKGYGTFICEFSDRIDWVRLRETTTKGGNTPGKMIIDAKAAKQALKISNTEAMVYILTKLYNKGLATNKQLKRKVK